MSTPEGPTAGNEDSTADRPGRLRRARAAIRRHRRGIGAVMTVSALLGVGVAGGWWLRGLEDATEEVVVSVDRPVVTPAESASDDDAPNLVGLDEEAARRVLFDIGLSGDAVQVGPVPAAGEPGVVVSQDPAPGEPLSGSFRVGISEPTTMPDLVSVPAAEATDALDRLGARTIVRSVYRPGAEEGTVVATAPVAGEEVPVEVTVTLAASPSSAFLATVDPLDSDCGTGDVSVAAVAFDDSVVCEADDEPRVATYALGRSVQRFEATLGLTDDSTPGQPARIVIRGDGQVLVDEVVAFGASIEVAENVSRVIQLSITVGFPGLGDCCPDVAAAIGSARVIGAPEAIDELVAGA